MEKIKEIFFGSVMLVAATIGAGIFALPYIFYQGGYALSLIYLVVLSAVVIYAHNLYWRTREAVPGHLLEISKKQLGKSAGHVATISVFGGLFLTLVVYLILGAKFIAPVLGSDRMALLVFWIAASLPLLFGLSRITKLEILGTFFTAGIILFIFFSSSPAAIFSVAPGFSGNAFLPFGAILFALAGWTGIEPMMDVARKKKTGKSAVLALIFGTVAAALLYLLFVLGIFGSAPQITPDTISGLIGWPVWKFWTIVALGLFALWTCYQPIAMEIKKSLEESFNLDETFSTGAVIAIPLFLVWAGLSDISKIVGLAGGVFLAFQYIFIILSARKKLKLKGAENFFSGTLVFVFLVAAIYEIYYFVLK